MAPPSWKVFSFFDVSTVDVPVDEDNGNVFDSNTLASLASGSSNLFLGTQSGHVHILSPAFKVIRSFEAHESGSIRHMKQIEGTALLVTIAEDLSSEPVLKVWALDKLDKKTGAPKCLSTLEIQNGRRMFPISAFAVLDDLSQLAIGFANGAVTMVRGDLIHDRGAKQRTVFESQEPITGAEFREGSNLTTLYLATTGRILTLTISGKGQGQPAKPLEDTGCGVGCMSFNHNTREIIVVRNDAIYTYGMHGRGPPLAYEGPKQLVKIFGQYVVLVSPPQPASTSKLSPMRFFGGSRTDDTFNTTSLSVLDTDLRYVAHSESLTSQVKEVFMEWGDLFILTLDGKLYRYHEKSLQQKLDILYQRNLFVLAINYAQKANLDNIQKNVILRRYGDFLYQKGDYDTAMQQYLKAIDNTEPSQVIRKFLDTQRIHNLIEYLEELHEHNRATIDHTTLLLNCYAKLKDTEKLETFIQSANNFDFDTAIGMCRQGGYYDQAVFLAKKHGEHSLVVDVLIEDSKQYDQALDYIWRLDAEMAYSNLMRYARVLLEHCPEDTTQIFVDYYTGEYRPMQDSHALTSTLQNEIPSTLPSLSSFIPLAYRPAQSGNPPSSGAQRPRLNDSDTTEARTVKPVPPYNVPKPRTAFSAFVDHPSEFIVFLESCLSHGHIDEADKIDLSTTLFELYLEMASAEKDNDKSEWAAKAKKLIDTQNVSIDPSNVLLLSHLSNYTTGTILVREQQNLLFDIFRSYTSAHDTSGAIKALRKYGPQEPQLYPAALSYFTSSARALEEAGTEFEVVLEKIDEDGLMAPLQVVQTLSQSGVATMGMVKKYLWETIERERKEIGNNRRLIASYRASTATKRDEIDSLTSNATTFQARRCSSCGGSLDLPTVHFLCKHSFHQRCVNQTPSRSMDGETTSLDVECPACEKHNAMVKAIRMGQVEAAGQHDLFRDALARSKDGLGVVSEFFGRGVMGGGSG